MTPDDDTEADIPTREQITACMDVLGAHAILIVRGENTIVVDAPGSDSYRNARCIANIAISNLDVEARQAGQAGRD